MTKKAYSKNANFFGKRLNVILIIVVTALLVLIFLLLVWAIYYSKFIDKSNMLEDSKNLQVLNISNCSPSTYTTEVKFGAVLNIRNTDKVEHKISFINMNIDYIVPANSTYVVSPYFNRNDSNSYEYRCDNNLATAGILRIID